MSRHSDPRRSAFGALVVLGWTGLAGCGASTHPSATAIVAPTPGPPTAVQAGPLAAGIRTGPGTRAEYTVQIQPAPGTCHYRVEAGATLPDPSCTPGAINPQVSQSNIGSTICRSGWTATIRPPAGITGPEKAGSALAYGYAGSFTTGEYDHLIPLELGGDPNDPANLWLQPNDDPVATSTHNGKDRLENTLNDLVCSGALTLADAQQAIASDWVAAARRYEG